MLKTFKGKLSFVYICLVILITATGIMSVAYVHSLGNSIDNLFDNNYNSIIASNKMLDALQKQDSILQSYANNPYKKGASHLFNNATIKFMNNYNAAAHNITEKEEKPVIDALGKYYSKYLSTFSRLQIIISDGNDIFYRAQLYYELTINPMYTDIRNNILKLSHINEAAMYRDKKAVNHNSKKYTLFLLIMSIFLSIIGFSVSRFLINKFLTPVSNLTNAARSVKEGKLDGIVIVDSHDEVGELGREFASMVKTISEFEKTTMGKLMAEKNRSIVIVKSISDPLIVLDNDYHIILLNNAFENLFQVNEKEAAKKHFLDVIKNPELFDYISNIYTHKSEQTNQKIMCFNLNNTYYYFNVTVAPIKCSNTGLNGIVVLLQNVTQLKQLEKMKVDFISTISHEFKTPLTSIMMGTTLITNKNIGELNSKQLEILDTIKEEGEKLSDLVTNLLQLVRLESSNAVFDIKPCSIVGIVQNSMKHFLNQAKEKDVSLHYELDEDLPKVNADFEKITWVINNIVSNALKFTCAGDSITVSAFKKNSKIGISISDTGMGIPEDIVSKIFERFVHMDDDHNESKGSGLGLAIAKEIVEAHGGEIWCESKLDSGSTFTFTLNISE